MTGIPLPRRSVDNVACLAGCSHDHAQDDPAELWLCETTPILVPVGTDSVGVTADLAVTVNRCLAVEHDQLVTVHPARVVLDGPDGFVTLTASAVLLLADALRDSFRIVDAVERTT